MSERALKQFVEKVCATCQKPFTDSDIVIMNAVDEDLEKMNRLREERSLAMKSKKQKAKKNTESSEGSAEVKIESSETTDSQKNGRLKAEQPSRSMKIEKPSGSSIAGSSKFFKN